MTQLEQIKFELEDLTSFYHDSNKNNALHVLDSLIADNCLDDFATKVAQTVLKHKKCSDKQLFIIQKGIKAEAL